MCSNDADAKGGVNSLFKHLYIAWCTMLPKRQRITRALFSNITAHGTVFHSKNATLRILPQAHTSAFSIVVSKKVARGAVERNVLRRRAYIALANIFDTIQHPYAGAFFLKKSAQKLSSEDLKHEFEILLHKASVILSWINTSTKIEWVDDFQYLLSCSL